MTSWLSHPGNLLLGGAEQSPTLRHVLWLSGGAGAGKTTIADLLAERLGWDVYHYHDKTSDHVARSTLQSQPWLHAFLGMNMDERWLTRSPDEMLRTLPEYHGERIGFIVEDILKLKARPIIVEGWGLLPSSVAPLLSSSNQALWLTPTEDFCEFAQHARGDLWTIPNKTSDARRARKNWLDRERLLIREIKAQANELGLRTVNVDSQSLAEMCDLVEQHFLSYLSNDSSGAKRSS